MWVWPWKGCKTTWVHWDLPDIRKDIETEYVDWKEHLKEEFCWLARDMLEKACRTVLGKTAGRETKEEWEKVSCVSISHLSSLCLFKSCLSSWLCNKFVVLQIFNYSFLYRKKQCVFCLTWNCSNLWNCAIGAPLWSEEMNLTSSSPTSS